MNPFHIGVITIAGAAIALSTIGAGKPSSLKTLYIDNTAGSGTVYLGQAGMDITTLVGVVLQVQSGSAKSIGGFANADNIDWQAFYVHGNNSGDKVLITGQTIS